MFELGAGPLWPKLGRGGGPMALNQAVGLLCNAVTEISFDCTHRDERGPNVDITCISAQGLQHPGEVMMMKYGAYV